MTISEEDDDKRNERGNDFVPRKIDELQWKQATNNNRLEDPRSDEEEDFLDSQKETQ